MDKFNHRRHFMGMGFVSSHDVGGQHHQRRTQPFPACANNILGNLINQHHIRGQTGTNDPINSLHIGLDHAAEGEYAERVHDLTAAVAAGAEAQVVRGMSWGATSGADLVLGILLGARAAWSTREVRAA